MKSEFEHEIDTAVRQNVEPDYRYAMTRAFVKMGHEVEPKWFSTLQITQDLTKSYRMREEVWDIAKKNLAYEDHIKKELSICQSSLCLDLVSFPVLSQIKPQAPLLVVPFRQFL